MNIDLYPLIFGGHLVKYPPKIGVSWNHPFWGAFRKTLHPKLLWFGCVYTTEWYFVQLLPYFLPNKPRDTVQAFSWRFCRHKFAFSLLKLKNNFIIHTERDLCREIAYSAIKSLYNNPFVAIFTVNSYRSTVSWA